MRRLSFEGWYRLVPVLIMLGTPLNPPLGAAPAMQDFPSSAHYQADDKTSVSVFTYQKILNEIFPGPGSVLRDIDMRISLRFTPSFERESQIVITKRTNGEIEIVRYLPLFKEGVYLRLEELRHKVGREDAAEMAKLVEVEKQLVPLSALSKSQLYAAYLKLQVSPAFDTGIALDGTTYELWGETASNKIHLAIAGSLSGQTRTDHGVVRWMATVRQTVEEALQKK